MPDFFAPCPRGLEAILHSDLEAIGAKNVKTTEGGVHFFGDWEAKLRQRAARPPKFLKSSPARVAAIHDAVAAQHQA